MILSILIATLPERAHFLDKMRGYLGPLPEGVEIVTDDRARNIPTGTKRNDLIRKAGGVWVVFVDDDDRVEPDYVSLIVEALKANPDCVTFQGTYFDTCNPTPTRMDWTIKLGEKYEARGNHIYRWPNHLAVMRKSIASQIRFPDIWQGEDYQWSKQIAERGLLKTEVHIPKQLYHYIYVSRK